MRATKPAQPVGLLTGDNRAAPARDDEWQARQDSNPDPARLELAMLPLHHGPARSRTYARLDSNQRPPPSQSGAHPLSYGRLKEPPAGVEPAPRPYKGRVLAVDTTEADRVAPAGVEPATARVRTGSSAV